MNVVVAPPRLLLPLLLLVGMATAAAAAPKPIDPIDETVAAFFRPYENEVAALSPDGRQVALSERLPGKPPAIVVVKVEERTTQHYVVDESREQTVVQLRWVS